MVAVRSAAAAEVPVLSAALAEAFLGESMTTWMMPQRTRPSARRALLFSLELQLYVLPHGGIVVTADDERGHGLVGGCLALPPDRWRAPDSVDGRTALKYVRTFGTKLPRASRVQTALQQHHPTEQHYYVRWIGVRPGLQGNGLGQALMRPVLDRADTDGVATYLEASSERSAAMYSRLGFIHLGVLNLPDGGPQVWPMRRPPAG